MATVYVIWNRSSKSFVGGAQPQTYTVQADATTQANLLSAADGRHEKQPKPLYDAVAVTVA